MNSEERLIDAINGELPELPAWKCHKVVGAAKIVEITHRPACVSDPAEMRSNRVHLQWEDLHWLVYMSDAWVQRFKPEPGGYLVIYEDHYTSFSPAKAFEDGYTLLGQPERADEPISVSSSKVILTPAGEIKQFEVTQYPEGCVQLTKEQALSLAKVILRRFE
ncbi:MAG TPA: hypothetical protein VL498_07070 [Terracidiphilus sp.]|jgi:hypothetical protein|nr:hypothetical protein [Terracidiphilus sp.]